MLVLKQRVFELLSGKMSNMKFVVGKVRLLFSPIVVMYL